MQLDLGGADRTAVAAPASRLDRTRTNALQQPQRQRYRPRPEGLFIGREQGGQNGVILFSLVLPTLGQPRGSGGLPHDGLGRHRPRAMLGRTGAAEEDSHSVTVVALPRSDDHGPFGRPVR
jgi:hypothetical protein